MTDLDSRVFAIAGQVTNPLGIAYSPVGTVYLGAATQFYAPFSLCNLTCLTAILVLVVKFYMIV